MGLQWQTISTMLMGLSMLTVYTREACSQAFDVHHRMTKSELKSVFGVDSHNEVPEYDVTETIPVDEQGQPTQGSRHRRHLDSHTFYNLKAFGRSLHIKLTPDDAVIAPNLVVTRHLGNGVTQGNAERVRLYSGHVTSHPGSRVAVSDEDGLTGMIRFPDESLMIQPLPAHHAKASGSTQRKHIIYRHPSPHDMQKRQTGSVEASDETLDKQKVLEVGIMADKAVMDVYGDGITRHLLILAHIMRNIFLDQTIGTKKINVVVNQIILDESSFGYSSDSAPVDRLVAIIAYATANLPRDDSDPGKPDMLLLLTKTSGGLAKSSSLCSEMFGNALATNSGLGSAAIMAHETAHAMGVQHDNLYSRTDCPDKVFLMSGQMSDHSNSMLWSPCSRENIQEWLSGPSSSCLDDAPPESRVLYEPEAVGRNLPGKLFTQDEQCRMAYGSAFKKCPATYSDCSHLMCSKDGGTTCLRYHVPIPDGTRCGPRHWCVKGQCTDDGSRPIDGGWSAWSSGYSACTRSCGGGVKYRTRACTNPRPANDGKPCEGSPKGHVAMCNIQDCPPGSMDYRKQQCIAKGYGDTHHLENLCLLYCPNPGGDSATYEGVVKDGTRCYSDKTNRDVCAQGKCMSVSCDYSINTGVKEDRCGVCDGDSSSCTQMSGFYNTHCPGWGIGQACNIFTAPVGATDVRVQKMAANFHVLGLKNSAGSHVIKHPTWSTVVEVAGTRVYYQHDSSEYRDRLYFAGPITEELTVVIIPIGGDNFDVSYKYSIPGSSPVPSQSEVQWSSGKWGECSRTCAGGVQTRTTYCQRKVDNSFVTKKICPQDTRPAESQACNTQACPPSWFADWSPCSATCGGGHQTRKIICRQEVKPGQYQSLADSSCSDTKPSGEIERACAQTACLPEWQAGDWSECSASCGGGIITRPLKCTRKNRVGVSVTIHNLLCHHSLKPTTEMACNQDVPCPTPPPWSFHSLGCYRNDPEKRALPVFMASFRDNIDWKDMNKTVVACAKYVREHSEYSVFAIEFYGECWSGPEAEARYNMYEKSEDCYQGTGSQNTLHAYKFNKL
ncbi:A disintegrin and metalloproteinase with thrombospondin motifs 18 isoform X4 [Nematostella vectensis]|uniref:A disintegrin and metalloproteinase with thrombospondin motifs 18 isoform X3 n=1 Tax=Nematostella vectensis TaxID=45351 RepID=UPI00207714E2|nr:A disintegrin and metalloproteinase with thrombospondin motifs 18 isoform X3 [Nematostella vectensis]XP_048589022.1 A disintegrin and metalloproteinase with thrombospondin motifs 18 isoform X4 [Nematostella vectensis]